MSPSAPKVSGVSRHIFGRRPLAVLLASATLVAGLAACAKQTFEPETAPDGAQLVQQSGQAMGSLSTVHLLVTLSPPLGQLPDVPYIKSADLDLNSEGDSKGTILLNTNGPDDEGMISLNLITLGAKPGQDKGESFINLQGSGWQAYDILAAEKTYDTAQILRAGAGLSQEMLTLTNATTTGSEKVDGTDSWVVTATFAFAPLQALIPAKIEEGDAITGKVWIAKDTHFLVKEEAHIPAAGANPADDITLNLSNFNAEVDIHEPVLGV